ncbi:MAG: hypothetical protein DRQ55_20345 [Planctomycetota bacterium]|nr:MAG: hypothetical protein DRQ55_20345 [Planctomycetota bacterium]
MCHAEVSDRYQGGLHGTLAAQGEAGAPGCVDCHTSHATLSKTDPASATFPVNVTALCSECHAEGQVADELNGDTPTEAVDSYLEGIHGRSLTKGGLLVTATCSSCHGSHQNLPADDPASSVALDNVAETCGSCHYGVTKQYRQSVHGIPAELVERSPSNPAPLGEDRRQASCKDCHRSHSIERSGTTAFRRELVSDCGACHEWHQSTFLWTTHGKATLLGGERAPSCDDCHGSHGIQPVSDQRSALHPDNIVATCAQCHEGSHEAFTSYRPHATPTQPKRWPLIFLVFWGMTGLLCATVLVTLTHSALFLYRLLKERGKWKAHHHKMSQPGADLRLYRRFNATTRNQHLVMVISFITLAMTGMTLKYAYTPWAGWVTRLLGGQARMSTLHLTSAVLLLGTFVWHVYTLFSNKKESGKSWLEIIKSPRSICFNGNDLKEVKATLSWFVGRGPRPVYNRFTYWEKFEYFAVCWGTFVIGSTGLAMWFPVQASYLISGWGLNIANLIHGFEALLAVASIFLVHFFNANLRPEKFPMDLTMFTGRMPVEELKFERMGEYQDLVDRGELEQHLVKPLPEGSERMIRVLASIALLTGLGLIGGIIYALLTY